MKFLKEYGKASAFEPETVGILSDAFNAAWAKLLSSGAPFASPEYHETAQHVIAKHLIDLAGQGERDASRLADSALLALSQAKLSRKYRAP